MKRLVFVAVVAAVLLAVAAVTALAAPGGPGFGMMGRGGYGHMNGYGMMGRGGYGHMNGYGMMGQGAMMYEDLEALLGLTHSEIHAAHTSGKSLVEIAAEKGVSEAQLTQALLDGRKAALAQAVRDGRLTQSAADEMYEFMETHIQTMVNAQGVGSMHGLGGMMGGNSRVAPCHGGQAPAQQGSGVRNNQRFEPTWLRQS